MSDVKQKKKIKKVDEDGIIEEGEDVLNEELLEDDLPTPTDLYEKEDDDLLDEEKEGEEF
jgi:hypothetical protein